MSLSCSARPGGLKQPQPQQQQQSLVFSPSTVPHGAAATAHSAPSSPGEGTAPAAAATGAVAGLRGLSFPRGSGVLSAAAHRTPRTSRARTQQQQAPATPERNKDHPHHHQRKNGAGRLESTRRQQQQQQQQAVEEEERRRQQQYIASLRAHYTPLTVRDRGPVEDVYTLCFLGPLRADTQDNEVAFAFKASMAKTLSILQQTRREGLGEALRQLRSISMCAAVEAAQLQQQQQAAGGGGDTAADGFSVGVGAAADDGDDAALGLGDAFIVPFDAVRAAMSGARVGPESNSTVDNDDSDKHSARRILPYYSETWSRAQRALGGGSGGAGDLTSGLFRCILIPRNDVRASMNVGAPVSVELSQSEALAWSTRRIQVELSPLEKLKQASRERSNALAAAAAAAAAANNGGSAARSKDGGGKRKSGGGASGTSAGNHHHRGTTTTTTDNTTHTTTTTEPPPPMPGPQHQRICTALTEIHYDEQELALRLLQGLCLTIVHQRRCIAEGCFFHYATEVFQCFLQHVEAVFTQRRLWHLATATTTISAVSSPIAVGGSTAPRGGGGGGSPPPPSKAAAAAGDAAAGSFYLSTPITLSSGSNSTASPSGLRPGDPNSTTAVFQQQQQQRPADSGPVEVEAGQVAVLIALVDAVEAACHYSPTCLTRFVQTGGVAAMLNAAYSPCVPEDIRAAILDTISILLQEVVPFRRAVVAAATSTNNSSNVSGGGGAPRDEAREEEALLTIMLEQAVAGSFHCPATDYNADADGSSSSGGGGGKKEGSAGGGGAGGRGAPPFFLDRASASKFESAVREWFSRHGLSHLLRGVMELRGLKDWRRLREEEQQRRSGAAAAATAGAAAVAVASAATATAGATSPSAEGGGGGGASAAAPSGGGSAAAMAGASAASIGNYRARQRATKRRMESISALLQAIDGKRADLR